MMTYEGLLQNLKNAEAVTVRGLKTKEMCCQDLFINCGRSTGTDFISSDERSLETIKKYLYGEFSWYLGGSREVKDIEKYSKFWRKIQNPDGTVNSNYGYLVFRTGQFDHTLSSLLKDPYSRQAVILYNNPDYYFAGNKDFICTQLQQFFIRDNKLISQVYIRSSDVILGLTYDIPWWRLVQEQLRLMLVDVYPRLESGYMKINFGSVHVYEDKFHLLEQTNIKRHKIELTERLKLFEDQEYYEKNLQNKLYIRETS